MENNQYKGFAYTKGSDKPTVVYGASSDDILAKLNSYNIARTEQDKFMKCNIGSLNTETSKYGDYHRYEVGTGKDISPIYLQIPPLGDNQFRKVIADLDAADAKFNPSKKRWYITPDQDLQKFQAICNQFSDENTKDTTQQMPKKTIDIHAELEKIHQMMPQEPKSNVPFQIEGLEIQYAVKLENQQTVIIPTSALHNKINMNGFLDELNEKAIEQLQQISSDLEQIDPEQIADESEYSISTSKDSADNRCTIWFNDGREPINFHGDEYGLHFPTMETDAVAEFVAEYFRQQDHPELSMQMEYSKGDWIDCYIPLNTQESSAIMRHQPLYVEGIRHIVGTVQEVWPEFGGETDAKSYEVLDKDGNVDTIRSDEIYAPDQARVLLRAAGDELTGVQFDLLADRRLSAAQMEEIRFGFKDGLSVEQVALYANPEMTPAEMDLCRIGLTNGLSYKKISDLLKETKELSWTDSRNRLNEVIKMVEKARTTAHEAGLAFSENMIPEEIDPEAAAAGMTVDEYAANGYEPYAALEEEATQTADFCGMKVPVENGMRVIPQKAIYDVIGIYDVEGLKKENIDFTNCIFRDITFKRIAYNNVLSDADFSSSKFYNCTFDGMDMRGSSFREASLERTRFEGAILNQCDFSKATITDSRFFETDVVEVNFSEAAMKKTVFKECAMERNNFFATRMDAVNVDAEDGITVDQQHLDTVIYTISGAEPEKIDRMKDKVMWCLSGSEITYERKEELIRLMENTCGNPDAQEWRDELTDAERDFVMDKMLQQKSQQSLSDVLLEKQHRQERYKERYNNMAAHPGERRSVVNQLHEKQKMVSVSAEAPAREDRIRKADEIAK